MLSTIVQALRQQAQEQAQVADISLEFIHCTAPKEGFGSQTGMLALGTSPMPRVVGFAATAARPLDRL